MAPVTHFTTDFPSVCCRPNFNIVFLKMFSRDTKTMLSWSCRNIYCNMMTWITANRNFCRIWISRYRRCKLRLCQSHGRLLQWPGLWLAERCLSLLRARVRKRALVWGLLKLRSLIYSLRIFISQKYLRLFESLSYLSQESCGSNW